MWAALLALVGADRTDAEITAIMLDPALPIGAHVRDQRNPVRALTAQLDKAREHVAKNGHPLPKTEQVWAPVLRRCADVVPEPIKWLWPQRFALGKLSLIAGHPGLGKSQLVLDLAARVSTAREWPCKTGRAPLGNVVILSAEDDLTDIIRPRLDAAGADVNRVLVLETMQQLDGDGRRGFDLTQDIKLLETAVIQVGSRGAPRATRPGR